MIRSGAHTLALPTTSEIRRLELSIRRHATAEVLGEFRSTFRGHGLTFSDLREYIPGDEIKRIHWKASARTGRMYVKNFEEERRLRIHVAADFSRSLFAGTDRSALARTIDCASLLAAFGVLNRDAVSLSLFGGTTLELIPSGSSRFHLKKIFGALLADRELSSGTDLDGHLRMLSKTLRRHTVIFIISDFSCAPFDESLGRLSRFHDVCGIEIPSFDPFPEEGLVLFEDPETGRSAEIDTSYGPARAAVERSLAEKSRALRYLFSASGGDFVRYKKSALYTLRALSHTKRAKMR